MVGTNAFEKNIKKYQIYVTVYGLASAGPLCSLFYLSADISFQQLSFIETVSLLVLIFFEIPTGACADLLGRKKSIALGCLLMGTEFVLIAAGFNYQVFVLAALIGGIGICLESGADDALLYDSLKKLNRQHEFKKYLGQSNAMFKMSAGIAGVVSSYVYGYDQAIIFYAFGAVFFFLAGFILTVEETITPKRSKQRNISKRLFTTIKRSCNYLLSDKKLMWMLLYTGIITAIIRAHTSIIKPSLLASELPNITYIGLVLAIAMTISSLISWHADKISRQWSENSILIAFAVIAGMTFISMGLTTGLTSVSFIFAITILNAFKSVYLSDYWHRHFSDEERVTLSSIKQACYSFFGILILIVVGTVTDIWGIQQTSFTLGIFIICSASALMLCKPR